MNFWEKIIISLLVLFIIFNGAFSGYLAFSTGNLFVGIIVYAFSFWIICLVQLLFFKLLLAFMPFIAGPISKRVQVLELRKDMKNL
jgi:hypothetical protein